jgi:hypothetical protein
MLENGAVRPMETAVSRDGLYQAEALFLVFGLDDLARLRGMADRAMGLCAAPDDVVDCTVSQVDVKPRQRVVNIGGRATVDGLCVPLTALGRILLDQAVAEDERNGFVPAGLARHVLTADDGSVAYCGGVNVCRACGVTLNELLSWREDLGRKAYLAFGRAGAHCSEATYTELGKKMDFRLPHGASLPPSINQVKVHVKEGVPDGLLQPCDCGGAEADPGKDRLDWTRRPK